MTQSIPGTFVDGKTPIAHPVQARIDGPDLHIFGDGVDARWPLKKLAADDAPGQGEIVLSVKGDYDARLTLKDIPPSLDAALAKAAPQAFHKGAITAKRVGLVVGLAAIAAGMVLVAFVGVPKLAAPLAQITPAHIEARMGESVLAQVEQDLGDPIEDPRAQADVQSVVDRIGKVADPRFPLQAQLMDADFANAFALPGGHVVVTCPLIIDLANPAELQAVLAHEIAHVTERHVMAGLIRNIGTQASLALLTGAGGNSGTIIKLASGAAQMSFSREDEATADRVGVGFLEAANLDASGLATFFDRMAKEESENDAEGDGTDFFSSHPASKARADAMRREPKGPEAQSLSADQWANLKNVCTPQ